MWAKIAFLLQQQQKAVGEADHVARQEFHLVSIGQSVKMPEQNESWEVVSASELVVALSTVHQESSSV